jgi:hypothetical protein
MLYVFAGAGVVIVNADHIVTITNKAISKM